MWLSLILLLLILGITIRQATQGLFGAFIMAALTVCCAGAALGSYEMIATRWLAPMWKVNFALPIALGASFGVPLLLLRLLFDKLVRRACLLPAWVDKIGGGVCGLVTAMTMVGIFAIALGMLPFDDGSVLGYSRVDVMRDPVPVGTRPEQPERELWLQPDRFAIGLASVLSDGIFSSRHTFYDHNPNLPQAIAWVGNANGEVSRFAPPGSISVEGAYPLEFVYQMKPPADPRSGDPSTYDPVVPAAGRMFTMVRVRLLDAARDENKSHLFTLRQFRLVGTQVKDGPLEQYHPVAIQQEDTTDATNRHIRSVGMGNQVTLVVDKLYIPRDNTNQIEIVFDLPTAFVPKFLDYKREARALVSFSDESPPAVAPASTAAAPARGRDVSPQPPADPATSAPPATPSTSRRRRRPSTPPPPTAQRRRRGGRLRGATANAGQSHFGADLPMTLLAYRQVKSTEVTGGKLVSGHLVGDVAQQSAGTDPPVSQFDVPDDKRLLQLSTTRLTARSSLGRAISQAVTTLQNYYVQDTGGGRYKIVGKYAVASANGKQVFEVQYFKDPVGSIGGLGVFDSVDESKLTPTDQFVLLFLVDPGARIVSFSTGGSASRQDDLTADNLVAPQ